MKPWEYINTYLEQDKELTKTEMPFGRYRGYSRGILVYKRKDNQPMQKEDIEALSAISFGQTSIVKGSPGQSNCTVQFECDSTD
jgi:hypothetical protein